MKSCCLYCGYFRMEKDKNGNDRPYCNDMDIRPDIYDPNCNYKED